MGSSRYSIGVRGIRSGQWSESKLTNLSKFDPGNTEINVVLNKFHDRIYSTSELTVITLPTHKDFIIPVDETDIRNELQQVPNAYLADLAGVILLGGSKKQEKTFRNNFAYGRYGSNVIFLHPFQKNS